MRFFLCVTFLCFVGTRAYVITQEGLTRTYLHRRLAGRQRKEVQREFLSLLGLNHRPKLNGVRLIKKTSAPLYMLGLYSQGSSNNADLTYGASDYLWQYNLAYRRAARPDIAPIATNNYDQPHSYRTNTPPLVKYIQEKHANMAFGDQMQHLNVVDENQSGPVQSALLTNEVEKQLIQDSDVVMSFINSKPPRDIVERGNRVEDLNSKTYRNFYFDIGAVKSGDRLSACKFRLFKERSSVSMSNKTLRISVYQVTESRNGPKFLENILVNWNQEGWLVFDVTPAMFDWKMTSWSNLGLLVSAETIGGERVKSSLAGIVGRKGEPSKQAFLVAFFSQGSGDVMHHVLERNRRNAAGFDVENDLDNDIEDDEENDNSTFESGENNRIKDFDIGDEENRSALSENRIRDNRTPDENDTDDDVSVQRSKSKRRARKRGRKRRKRPCHKREMYVNFKDLSWHEWIIAPPGYHAHFCSGECIFPMDPMMNATNHAVVQAMVVYMYPKRKIPKPCCSPSTLGEISVLYYDNATLVYKKYQNMVVESCGCQ